MTSLVSIIMPAYNAEKHIEESIQSVINQTYKNWELIIVDDGSTDNTKSIVKQNIERDNRIRYYYQKNGKQGKARNLAISKANGNWLAFLDSDDLWFENKLSHQIDYTKNKEVDLIFSDAVVFEDIINIDLTKTIGSFKGVCFGEDSIDLFLNKNQIPILTVIVKKKCLENVGNFSEKPQLQNAEDYHLWLKLLFEGSTFIGLDECHAAYRVNPQSATFSNPNAPNQVKQALINLRFLYPNNWDKITTTLNDKRYESRLVSNMRYLIFQLLNLFKINFKNL